MTSHPTKLPTSAGIRVLVAKAGLDGHDRGAKVVARALVDAGVEVEYTGLHQSAKQIAQAAVSHNVGAVGLSVLSGAHPTLFADVLAELKAANAEHVLVFGGGVIPSGDIPALLAEGVKVIFTPGTPLSTVTSWVVENVPPSQMQETN